MLGGPKTSNDVASLHKSHGAQCANLLTGNARVLGGPKTSDDVASLHKSHGAQGANVLTGNARVLGGPKKLCREHGRVQPGLLLPANQGQA